MTTDIRWRRSDGGCTESHCGTYSIEPQFNGCTTAQSYTVYFHQSGERRVRVGSYANTQRDAKEAADTHARHAAEEAARRDCGHEEAEDFDRA